MEQLAAVRPLGEVFATILDNETRLVELFVPANAQEQREAFLAGETRNPVHRYDRLAEVDFTAKDAELELLEQEISSHAEIPSKHMVVYTDLVRSYRRRNRFAELAAIITHPDTDEDTKQICRQEYMLHNVEQNGEPDRRLYGAILNDIRTLAANCTPGTRAASLSAELVNLIPENSERAERFVPSQETFEWMKPVTEALYGGMLAHVPDSLESFSPAEVAETFRMIIREEFGEAAADWQVVVEKAKSINVQAAKRRIVIPENRKPITPEHLKGLVAHEIGVHMLRAVMGSETDLLPLGVGLVDIGDCEEGLGGIMEQVVEGKLKSPSELYPLIASLMYYDSKDFRDTFEIIWRHLALQGVGEHEEVTDEMIEKARSRAYAAVGRIARGTDSLPWFKDISYYNGQTAMWRHLDMICGDDLGLQFLLMGKADPTRKAQQQLLLETKSV